MCQYPQGCARGLLADTPAIEDALIFERRSIKRGRLISNTQQFNQSSTQRFNDLTLQAGLGRPAWLIAGTEVRTALGLSCSGIDPISGKALK